MRNCRFKWWAVLAILLVMVASLSVVGQSAAAAGRTAVSLSEASDTVGVGETTTTEVVVESADQGVRSYTFTVDIGNDSVASIEDVKLRGAPEFKQVNVSKDNGSVTATAAGANTSNTGTVAIASLTIRGETAGEANVSLSVDSLGDEENDAYTVVEANGTDVTVSDATEGSIRNVSVRVSPSSVALNTNDTTAVDIVADAVDQGIGSYTVTTTLGNTDVASIESVQPGGDPEFVATNITGNGSTSTVSGAAADTDDTGTITIASLGIRGVGIGETNLSASVETLGNEENTAYAVTQTNGATLKTRRTQVVDVALTNPRSNSLNVSVRTLDQIDNLTVTLGGVATTGASYVTGIGEGGSFTERVNQDGTYTYTAAVRAQSGDGYQARIESIEGSDVNGRAVFSSRVVVVRTDELSPANPTTNISTSDTNVSSIRKVSLTLDQAPNAVTDVAILTSGAPPETMEKNTQSLRDDTGAIGRNGTAISAININLDRNVQDTPATIEFTLPRSSFTGDPDRLLVARFNESANEYETLPTAVVQKRESLVTVRAQTPGFSLFILTSAQDDTDDSTETGDAVSDPSGLDSGESTIAGSTVKSQTISEGPIREVTLRFTQPVKRTVNVSAVNELPETASGLNGQTTGAVSVSLSGAQVNDSVIEITLDQEVLNQRNVSPSELLVVGFNKGSRELKRMNTTVLRRTERRIVLSVKSSNLGIFAVVIPSDQRLRPPTASEPSSETTTARSEVTTGSTPLVTEGRTPSTSPGFTSALRSLSAPEFGIPELGALITLVGLILYRIYKMDE